MVSPYDGQAAKWESEYRERHTLLFAAADVVTASGREYTKGSMLRRKRYLVENADLVLATYDGQPGGTAMAVQYAREMGIPVQNMCPARGWRDQSRLQTEGRICSLIIKEKAAFQITFGLSRLKG